MPLRLGGRPEGQVRADVMEMLRWMGLTGKLVSMPEDLSGGERQRVAIARAVIVAPRLLMADEPTGALEPHAIERGSIHLLRELHRLGSTVIIATHNQALVDRYPGPAMHAVPGNAGGNRVRMRVTPSGTAQFDELGLRRALADRMVPFLVAAMAFLAALAIAGWIGASVLIRHWETGAGSTLDGAGAAAGEPAAAATAGTRLSAVQAVLAGAPGVKSAKTLSNEELNHCFDPGLALI